MIYEYTFKSASLKKVITSLDYSLADRIRLGRQLAGWSTRELGQMIGVSLQQVQKYEIAQNRISAAKLLDIANALGRPIQWFYGSTSLPKLEPLDAYPELLNQLRCVMTGPNEQDRTLLQNLLHRLTSELHPLPRSVFAFQRSMPVVKESWPGAAQQVRNATCGHFRVLLVDDDHDVLTLLSSFVKKAGYEPFKASSGDAALQFIALGEPLAAIVTDYAMPGMNGAALLAEIAQLRPALPALIVTGYADSAVIDDIAPNVEILRKPLRRGEFVAKLHALIASGQPKVALM